MAQGLKKWIVRPSEKIINLWMTQDIKYDFSLDSDFCLQLSAIHFLNNRGYEKYLHMHVLYY